VPFRTLVFTPEIEPNCSRGAAQPPLNPSVVPVIVPRFKSPARECSALTDSRMTTNPGAKPANGRPVHIPYLDPFRGLAIIMIMLTHFPAPKWALNLVSPGTIFLVFIAGFLMAHLYCEATSVSSFSSQKIKRIILRYLIAATPGIAEILLRKYDLAGSNSVIRTLSTGLGHRNDAH
jgi:hypothetical protein